MHKGLEPNYELRDLRLQELNPWWDPARMATRNGVFHWMGPGKVTLSQFDFLCLKSETLGSLRQQASNRMNKLKREDASRLPQDQLLSEFNLYQGFYRLAGDLLRLDDSRQWKPLGEAASKARHYFIGLGMPQRYSPTEALAWVVQSLVAEGRTDEQICIHGWMRSDLLVQLKHVALPLPLDR